MLKEAVADGWTTFIPLSSRLPPTTVTPTKFLPLQIRDAVNNLLALDASSQLCTFVLDEMEAGSLVALAGLLLEYPVAYTPDISEVDNDNLDALLGEVEMQIFSCKLVEVRESTTQRNKTCAQPFVLLAIASPTLAPNIDFNS